MGISKLTDEQLNRAMNDTIGSGVLNRKGGCAVCDCARECPEIDEREQKQYITDWSLTGPLAVKYGLELLINNAGNYSAINGSIVGAIGINKNPLGAICECILMIHQAKRT